MDGYTRIEYMIKTLAMNPELCEQALNELGQQGWRLVTVDFETRRYYLIREKSNTI